MHTLELGLDMSLLWNRMTLSRLVTELGGAVISQQDRTLSFILHERTYFMETGPFPVFRIGARYSVPPDEMATFMGAATRFDSSGCSVEVMVNPQTGTASFSCPGFAYGEKDLLETLLGISRKIDNAASVLTGMARDRRPGM